MTFSRLATPMPDHSTSGACPFPVLSSPGKLITTAQCIYSFIFLSFLGSMGFPRPIGNNVSLQPTCVWPFLELHSRIVVFTGNVDRHYWNQHFNLLPVSLICKTCKFLEQWFSVAVTPLTNLYFQKKKKKPNYIMFYNCSNISYKVVAIYSCSSGLSSFARYETWDWV